MTLLVVDDEANVRHTMQVALEAAGYTVVTASDAAEGEQVVRQGAPLDMVILDERMPGIDGLELARRIRGFNPGVPILLVTAYGSVGIVSAALREGASGFLEKPFTPAQLRDTVARILAAHGAASQPGDE
jgi:DNA-binding NtrC family response regulator